MSRGLTCAACLLAVAAVRAEAPEPPPIARGTWVDQEYAAAPADNPLKGLLPFRGRFTAFPHSMEWGYVAWKIGSR
jgi:hypothetical protein